MTLYDDLLNLIPESLKPLTPLEVKLIQSVSKGVAVSGYPVEPIDVVQIGNAQIVRSEILVLLLTRSEFRNKIHHKGIHLIGAKITGVLDLEDSTIEQPLRLVHCIIEEKILLDRGKFKLLELTGSQTMSISAEAIQVSTDILMKHGFKATGKVCLLGANIGGDLVCSGAIIENSDGVAFIGDKLRIGFSLYLNDGFKVKGETRLLGANIGDQLDCSGAVFDNPNGCALIGDGISTGDMFLNDGFKARGEVRFLHASIGGQLNCSGADFENPSGYALSGDYLTTSGSIYLGDGFTAKGEVSFQSATIGGRLDCGGANFENPSGYALSGDYLTTNGLIYLGDGFIAKGEVSFQYATIGNNLDCNGAIFENQEGFALRGDGLTTRGDIYLTDGFIAKGEVSLIGANVRGNLDCANAELLNPDGDALNCDRLRIQGTVFLCDDFKAKGAISLIGADIGGGLHCIGGTFENPNGIALTVKEVNTHGSILICTGFSANGEVDLRNASIAGNLNCNGGKFINPNSNALTGTNMRVNGSFIWKGLIRKPIGKITLQNANLVNLEDEEESWPDNNNLNIDGLVYGPFTSQAPADSKSRSKWLNLRNSDHLSVQPYEQLIRVFRQMGLRDDAHDIAIAKQRFLRKRRKGISRLWSWILDVTISYGYRPEKVILLFILPIILLGSGIFAIAFSNGTMGPTTNTVHLASNQIVFDPVGYSLDVFLPIVDLHQEGSWAPNLSHQYGIYFQYYLYFHILAGWFFTTLAVAAVTGLVKSD